MAKISGDSESGTLVNTAGLQIIGRGKFSGHFKKRIPYYDLREKTSTSHCSSHMDLHNFYIDSKRTIGSSFRLLRPADESSEKMSKPFQFPGVSVSDALFEEHCFAHLQHMAHNTHLNFQEMTKNNDGGPKRACFDQDNRFQAITFSKLVGGFVGSKSQSGASKEPLQIWDVILRQDVDVTCQGNLKNGLLDCISRLNVEKSVPSAMFVPLCPKRSSTLDASLTYLLSNHCGIFEGKKPPKSSEPKEHCMKTTSQTQENSCHLELTNAASELGKEKNCEKPSDVPRQSYADVARTFAVKRGEVLCDRRDSKKSGSLPLSRRNVRLSDSDKMRTKHSKKDMGSFVESSLCSSRHNFNRRFSQNMEKPININKPKLLREKREHLVRLFSDKTKPSELQKYCNSGKSRQILEDRKPRNYKFKNNNMKEKERKNLDQQLQEDISFICNNPEENCKNWRCKHNRVKSIPSSRVESQILMKPCRMNRAVDETTVPSLPSHANKIKLNGSDKSSVTLNIGYPPCFKDLQESNPKMHLSLSPQTSQDSMGDGCSESSFSSGSSTSVDGQPVRNRVASDCSVDSKDSVIFESDDCKTVQTIQNIEESDIESDCSSEIESVEDDSDYDEVDFCQVIATFGVEENLDQYVSEWLQDVNNKWHKENAMIPRKEKEPKKVRFAENKDLVKVHLLVKWDYAYRSARVGPWEEMARDRSRFRTRIIQTESVLAPIFDPEHRRKVWEARQCSSAVL